MDVQEEEHPPSKSHSNRIKWNLDALELLHCSMFHRGTVADRLHFLLLLRDFNSSGRLHLLAPNREE